MRVFYIFISCSCAPKFRHRSIMGAQLISILTGRCITSLFGEYALISLRNSRQELVTTCFAIVLCDCSPDSMLDKGSRQLHAAVCFSMCIYVNISWLHICVFMPNSLSLSLCLCLSVCLLFTHSLVSLSLSLPCLSCSFPLQWISNSRLLRTKIFWYSHIQGGGAVGAVPCSECHDSEVSAFPLRVLWECRRDRNGSASWLAWWEGCPPSIARTLHKFSRGVWSDGRGIFIANRCAD